MPCKGSMAFTTFTVFGINYFFLGLPGIRRLPLSHKWAGAACACSGWMSPASTMRASTVCMRFMPCLLYTSLPEGAFYMVGTIDEAIEKAEKMKKGE